MSWSSRIIIGSASSPDELTRSILEARNVTDIDAFLSPSPIDETFYMKVAELFGDELCCATDLVMDAVRGNVSIVIHGDYDVDGVSATAILWETLYNDMGYKNVSPFIPHRVDHGYGLSIASIDDILDQLLKRDQKPGLLISVDCGITAKDAVEYANKKGFTVIITDHHTRPDKESDLPSAVAILHTYELCGAGVSWVFACSLRNRYAKTNNSELSFDSSTLVEGVDLVALATLADIQKLTGFNRSLVTEGLVKLTHTNRTGLLALYQLSDIVGKPIRPYEVGWIIAPRLNASGRLDHALDALRLLVVQNNTHARTLAIRLNDLNRERQKITKDALDQALLMVEQSWNGTSPIVVYSDNWHEGIIGLIAGKLTQKFNMPVLALTVVGSEVKGSARSVPGINIVDLLKRFGDLFTAMGGHAQAAGCSLNAKDLKTLLEQMSAVNIAEECNIDNVQNVVADAELPIKLVSLDHYDSLERLEPFGMGNPRPMFISRNVLLTDVRTVGKTESHLKLKFGKLDGIAFGMASGHPDLSGGDTVDVLYTIDRNEYNGRVRVQVKVEGIQNTGK